MVVAMDINPRHLVTAGLLADHYEQVPLSAAPEFAPALLGVLQRYEVGNYLPLFPEEIMVAAKLRGEGHIPASVTVMAPPPAASAACADKWMLTQFLQKHGVPVPQTCLASEACPGQELFLKPRKGTGSHGARRAGAAELAALVGASPTDWVVQEICSAPEVTVDAFYDPLSGFNHAVCRERIEIKSGVSTKARLFADETLERFARSLAEALGLAGAFCFQVMRKLGAWVVTDVNPRPGAATAMCGVTGNDFFAATFARCWGRTSGVSSVPLRARCSSPANTLNSR